MHFPQSKQEVQIIIENLMSLCKQISSNLPFDRRKKEHKVWYEQLVDLFSSLHNCKVLENPSSNTILTGALVLIPENSLGKKDELTLPNTIYFHLRKDMRIRLEPEDTEYENNILEKDCVDSYEVMLQKIQTFIEKHQL